MSFLGRWARIAQPIDHPITASAPSTGDLLAHSYASRPPRRIRRRLLTRAQVLSSHARHL